MIVIRSIIEKGGPGQITCNYHTIIPDTVACTIFNMLFVTFGGGHSVLHIRAFIHSFFLSLSSSRTFSIILSLSFSLSFSLLRIPTSDNSGQAQIQFNVYMYIKIYFFFTFLKMLHSTMRIFLLLSLTLFLFLCTRPPPIFSLYTLPRHQLDSKSQHALPRVSKRETEKLIKWNYDQTRDTIKDLSVLPVEELIWTFEMRSKDQLKRQYNDIISVFQVSC